MWLYVSPHFCMPSALLNKMIYLFIIPLFSVTQMFFLVLCIVLMEFACGSQGCWSKFQQAVLDEGLAWGLDNTWNTAVSESWFCDVPYLVLYFAMNTRFCLSLECNSHHSGLLISEWACSLWLVIASVRAIIFIYYAMDSSLLSVCPPPFEWRHIYQDYSYSLIRDG
jgi:hypothetical protein